MLKKVLYLIWFILFGLLLQTSCAEVKAVSNYQSYVLNIILAKPLQNGNKLSDNILEYIQPIYVENEGSCDKSLLLPNKITITRLDTGKTTTIIELKPDKIENAIHEKDIVAKLTNKIDQHIAYDKVDAEFKSELSNIESPILSEIGQANLVKPEWDKILAQLQTNDKILFIAPDVSSSYDSGTPQKVASYDEYKQKLTNVLCQGKPSINPEIHLLVDSVPNLQEPQPVPVSPPTTLTPTPQAKAETLLRFHGSNTIGGKLLPALAEAFLAQEGYTNVHKEQGGKEDESFVMGEQKGHKVQIEIQAHGSKTAFDDLENGSCDIGMSTQKIKKEEIERLYKLGNLISSASEHVLALDGIALIVHPSNPVRKLSIAQVADIFSGTTTDWSQIGGGAGSIAIYARDDNSGTYDYFKDAVLKTNNKSLASNAQRFEDSKKLAEAVNKDSQGIGFIGLNYIGANKVIALSDTDVDARKPSLLTIKTEDYILSRELYLYTHEKPTNPNVFKFIEFAVGAAAQPVVATTGLVPMDIEPLPPEPDPDDPRKPNARWRMLTEAAIELPLRVRFHTDSHDLDNKANRDIGRIASLLSRPSYKNKKVVLIGFTDASGDPKYNLELSQERVEIVKNALSEEGVGIREAEGIGAEAFVAHNDTNEDKAKNRRVEVWVK